MAQILTGKSINEFASTTYDLPNYFGGKYMSPEQKCSAPYKKVNGEFISKKYNAIIRLIDEMEAKVIVKDSFIHITYTNGEIKIDRDLLTDTFLIPKLNTYETT